MKQQNQATIDGWNWTSWKLILETVTVSFTNTDSRAPLGSTWRVLTGDGDANRSGSVSLCVAKSASGKISPLVVENLVLQDKKGRGSLVSMLTSDLILDIRSAQSIDIFETTSTLLCVYNRNTRLTWVWTAPAPLHAPTVAAHYSRPSYWHSPHISEG